VAAGETTKSTLPEPILVGPGPEGAQAAEFFLTIADWVLGEQEVGLRGPLEGDLSDWVAGLAGRPVHFEPHGPVRGNEGAIFQVVHQQALEIAADPNEAREKQIADLVGSVAPEDLQRMFEALKAGEVGEANKIRSEAIKKLHPQLVNQITPESIPAFAAMVKRGRAALTAALCLLAYKVHPLTLIAQARRGDRQAVLNLIKVDKLFLNDRCTAQVIHDAALQKDRPYLEQLARAIKYTPKTGWRHGCRLYLYLLFNFVPRFGASVKIYHRIDPDGTRFKTIEAFQKFVERSKKEFDRLQADLGEHPEEKA